MSYLIQQIPKVQLANLPTPLEEMSNLSKLLGGPRLWIKRDDVIPLALGGSKVRLLEYLMADAKNQGADIIITGGSPSSNFVRLAVAASCKLGLKAIVVYRGKKPRKLEGNLLLTKILGAEIHFAGNQELKYVFEKVAAELKNRGYSPYILCGLPSIGLIGYVNEAFELERQSKKLGFDIDYIIVATSSGGIQAGLTFGNMLQNSRSKIIGVSPYWRIDNRLKRDLLQNSMYLNKLMGTNFNFSPENFRIVPFYSDEVNQYIHDQYRVMNIISLVARTEGVLLDPIYTGKAMVVLLEMIKRKEFTKKENIVFIHSGGTPSLFATMPGYPFTFPPAVYRLFTKNIQEFDILRKIAAFFLN